MNSSSIRRKLSQHWLLVICVCLLCCVSTLYLQQSRLAACESNADSVAGGGKVFHQRQALAVDKQAKKPASLGNEAYSYNDAKAADDVDPGVLQPASGGSLSVIPEYQPSKMAIIWIGGMPRSGTTLMRAMLDAHPDVRCGEETRVLPRILGMRTQWKRNEKENKRLNEAGITDHVIDAAVSAFITEVVVRHGRPAPRYCNKDPFTLKSVDYLKGLFPKSKFLLMVRDGRATVHSIISRKITITGFDLNNPRQCLQKWNQALSTMYEQCRNAGPDMCMPVYYEQLVLKPEKWLREILGFLNLPWNSSVLHHEQFVGGKISISAVERSTDQIVKPVNTAALAKWVGFFPDDVVADMATIAPMLKQLGYDPTANPPNYGEADEFVARNNEMIESKKDVYANKLKDLMGADQAKLALERQAQHDKGERMVIQANVTTRKPPRPKYDDQFVA